MSLEERLPIRVAAAVIRSGGRILITRRAGGRLEGYWEFPGGKVEPGETEEAALVREIREELGLEIRVERFLGESVYCYPEAAVRLRAYWCAAPGTEPAPPWLAAHDAFAWVAAAEMAGYRFAPADLPLLPLVSGGG